jgi:hypothetical protein
VSNDAIKEKSETLAALYASLNVHGYPDVDLAKLRKIHPGLLTLEGWLKVGGAQKLSALSTPNAAAS